MKFKDISRFSQGFVPKFKVIIIGIQGQFQEKVLFLQLSLLGKIPSHVLFTLSSLIYVRFSIFKKAFVRREKSKTILSRIFPGFGTFELNSRIFPGREGVGVKFKDFQDISRLWEPCC